MDTKKFFEGLKKSNTPCVIGIAQNNHLTVALNGKADEMLYIMHELYWNLHEELRKEFGKRCADMIMNTISKTDEEIEEEHEKMKNDTGIPEWLKKMMDFDEDEVTYDDEEGDDDADYSVDEADGDEEDGDEEDDEPVSYTFRGNGLRLDISIHPDDAVRDNNRS